MTSNTTQGWVDQPNTRGTIDIIWSSLSPIFLCTWTVLCLNLPYPGESWLSCFVRKVRWWFLALMAPELLIGIAAGQWALAKKSVEAFKASKHEGWTLQHAFYANMGGFILESSDSPPFPVNGKQLHWLIEHRYVDFPSLTVDDIGDKSKGDRLSRVITLAQITWFLLQAFGRVAQGLAITTLEVSTVAFVFCTFGTYFFWLYKPLDIQTPNVLKAKASIAEILTAAGPVAAKPYRQTPLDFIDRNGPTVSINALPLIGWKFGTQKRPLDRIPNDRFPVLELYQQAILWVITLIYAAVHFWAWNGSFASDTEHLLWRVGCLVLVSATMLFWMVDRPIGWYHSGQPHVLVRRFMSSMRTKRSRNKNSNVNAHTANSSEKDATTPRKRGKRYPLAEALFMFVLGVIYIVALSRTFNGLMFYLISDVLTGSRCYFPRRLLRRRRPHYEVTRAKTTPPLVVAPHSPTSRSAMPIFEATRRSSNVSFASSTVGVDK